MEVSIALVPATKGLWYFLTGLWNVAKKMLCGNDEFMTLTRFVQQDDVHR